MGEKRGIGDITIMGITNKAKPMKQAYLKLALSGPAHSTFSPDCRTSSILGGCFSDTLISRHAEFLVALKYRLPP